MTVLYINGEHCTSLKQLKGYFSEDLTPESDVYADLLDYGRHGDIARWLSEKGESELSSKVDSIDSDLRDSAFFAHLKAIILGVTIEDVTDSGLLKPMFNKCFLFEDFKYDVKDTEAMISISLKVLKCVNEEYELSVSCNWGTRVMKVNPYNHTEGKITDFDFTFYKRPSKDMGEISVMAGGIELKRLSKSNRECDEFSVGGVSFKMIYVEGGSFMMGMPDNDSDAFGDEKPLHRVTLCDYYIGETQVTQALWKAIMSDNPSNWKDDNLPVEKSWEDCQEFIKQLNKKTGKIFRLPTEAEWEYAARGGRRSLDFKYAGSNDIDKVAWYNGNSGDKIHPVKQKAANELGLYDMSGNVWEWCGDLYGYDSYSSDSQNNPKGPSSGCDRVLRGGGWISLAENCRITYRNHSLPYFSYRGNGFRLVLIPQ